MTLTDHFVVQRDPTVPGPWQVLAGGDRTAGSLIFGEARLPAHSSGQHTFANLGAEPVWAFGVTSPAGLEGMFAEQTAYFASLDGPPDPERLREIGDRYGVRALGPPLDAT